MSETVKQISAPQPGQTSAPSMRTVVQHGLEIFAQALGKKLNIDAKPLVQDSINEFVRSNVADEPISLRPMLENAGFIRREKKQRRLPR